MGAADLRHPFGIIIGLSGRSRSSGRGGRNTRFGLWVHAPPTEPLEKTCNVPDRSDADQQEAPSMSNFCGRADIKIRERHFRELAREYDPPAHAHVVVEIHDVPVVPANAAPRDKMPDGPWAVCPMYCQLIIIEDKRGGSHWITRRIGGNDPRRPAASDLRRRRPGRTKVPAGDTRPPKPLFVDAAHSDRVSDGPAFRDDEIKAPLIGPHHDRPRPRLTRKLHNVSCQ